MPRTAIMYLTSRCNLRCVFCLERDPTWNEFDEPRTAEALAEIERLRARGADHITLMGAETFFRKDLRELLAHARSVGFSRLGVVTNGTILSSPGFLAPLVDAGLAFIELSVHAHDAALAEEVSGKEFTFERQRRAFEEIRAAALPTIVNVVLCRPNREASLDIARYVSAELGDALKFVKLKLVGQMGATHGNQEVSLRYSEIDPLPAARWLLANEREVRFFNFPLCRLGDLARYSQEVDVVARDERFFDFDHHGGGYWDNGHQWIARAWPEKPCGSCPLRPVCPGVERRYAEQYGTAELRPVEGAPEQLLAQVLGGTPEAVQQAVRRVEVLRSIPRPDVGSHVEERLGPAAGGLALCHPDLGEPLVLQIESLRDSTKAFFRSRRFGLSYGLWKTGDPYAQPLVVEALGRACAALQQADQAGLDQRAACSRVVATLAGGWKPAAQAQASQGPAARASGCSGVG